MYFLQSMKNALFTLAELVRTGSESGVFQTFRSLGSVLATSLIGAVFGGKATTGSLHAIATIIFDASLVMASISFSRRLV